MPCLTRWTIYFAQWLCPCGQGDHQPVLKTITWLLLSRLPHRNSLEPSEPCLRNARNPPEPTPARARTLGKLPQPSITFRNLPELASGTYTSTRQHTPELAGTLRNPPEPCLRNLHQRQNSPELSGISGTCLWNLHQHRNPPEPLSRTCSCDPHQHTPELIWAEDPIRLRCWGINSCVIPNSFEDLGRFFHNLPLKLARNSPEPHQPFAPDAFGTSLSFCSGTRRNLVYYLHRDPRNLIRHLHRNAPEPHQPSAPESPGTSSPFCPGTLRNLVLQLHQIAVEGSSAHTATDHLRMSYSGLKTPLAYAVGEKRTVINIL